MLKGNMHTIAVRHCTKAVFPLAELKDRIPITFRSMGWSVSAVSVIKEMAHSTFRRSDKVLDVCSAVCICGFIRMW